MTPSQLKVEVSQCLFVKISRKIYKEAPMMSPLVTKVAG